MGIGLHGTLGVSRKIFTASSCISYKVRIIERPFAKINRTVIQEVDSLIVVLFIECILTGRADLTDGDIEEEVLMRSIHFHLNQRRIQICRTDRKGINLSGFPIGCHAEVGALSGSIACSIQTHCDDIYRTRLNDTGLIAKIYVEGNIAKSFIQISSVGIALRDGCPLGNADRSIAQLSRSFAFPRQSVKDLVFCNFVLEVRLCPTVRVFQLIFQVRMHV